MKKWEVPCSDRTVYGLSNELIDVVSAEPDFTVVLAAHLDFCEHIFIV